jgi:probable rRNA maturation factor
MMTSSPLPNSVNLSFSLVVEAPAPAEIESADLERLTAFVLEAEGAAGEWEITVALVDDVRLQELHRDYMGVDTATDIMTFPLDDATGSTQGGDLVISLDHALMAAETWGLQPADETRFLVAHGLLHLLGWRDDSDDDRERMLDRQRELIARWRQA